MLKIIKPIIILAASFLFMLRPFPAGADVSVRLRLDRKEATQVDSISMIVSVSGSRKIDSQIRVKGMEPFNVTQGGSSSRVEVINGKVNSGIDYTFYMQPKKSGTFRIGPAEVTVKGKTFRSNVVTLKVVPPVKSSGADRGPLFLSAGLSSKEIYVEEQAVYTLKLYRRTKVADISLKLPEKEHLTFKKLGEPVEYKSVYNGRSYQVLEVRYALIPSKKGLYGIGPAEMGMTVFQPGRRSRRGFFDDPFFDDPFFSSVRGRPVTLTSEPLELNVLPLPEDGRPAGFSGLVGNFTISATLKPDKVKAGESATLTVVLAGRGNVNRIPDLKMPELARAKIYADQPILKIAPDGEGMAGSKTMKWALVPEKEGKYRVPPLSVSFFNTTSRKYSVISTPPLLLSVLQGEKKAVNEAQSRGNIKRPESPSKQAIKELGHDILPVHTSVKDMGTGFRIRMGGPAFWILLMGPVLIYAATFFGLKLGRKSMTAIAVSKSKKAAKKFMKKYRQERPSYHGLISAIREYLNDRFDLSLGALTSSEVLEIIRSKGVGIETAEKMRDLVQRLEDAVYTGHGNDTCDMGQEIPGIIRQIEKEAR